MSRCFATVTNTASTPWVFGLYLSLGDAGLPYESVGWLVLPAPPRSPALPLSWDDGLDVCIGDRSSTGGQSFYKTVDLQPTQPGWRWKLTTFQGEPLLEQIGSASQPDLIQFDNVSGKTANLGLGRDSKAGVYVPRVLSNTTLQVKLPLRYRAALFVALVPGQVVQPLDVPIGPIDVAFPGGSNSAAFLISESIDGISLSVSYGVQVEGEQKTIDEMRRRLGSG